MFIGIFIELSCRREKEDQVEFIEIYPNNIYKSEADFLSKQTQNIVIAYSNNSLASRASYFLGKHRGYGKLGVREAAVAFNTQQCRSK